MSLTNCSCVARDEPADGMDFLNDEMQINDAGESNKEFGIALKQNASYLLRYISYKMSDMNTALRLISPLTLEK